MTVPGKRFADSDEPAFNRILPHAVSEERRLVQVSGVFSDRLRALVDVP